MSKVIKASRPIRFRVRELDRAQIAADLIGFSPHRGADAQPGMKSRTAAEELVVATSAEAKRLRQEAESLLAEARRQAANIESEAYAQGFDQGRKDGEELGRRQYEATVQRLEQLISALKSQGQELSRKYEAQMVRLALAVARRLVHREVETDPSIVAACMQTAMRHVVEGSHIRLRLHPQDADLLAERDADDLASSGRHPLEVVPDAQISRGGCLIETKFGLVDATRETQWRTVEESIEQILFQRTGLSRKDFRSEEAFGATATDVHIDTSFQIPDATS